MIVKAIGRRFPGGASVQHKVLRQAGGCAVRKFLTFNLTTTRRQVAGY